MRDASSIERAVKGRHTLKGIEGIDCTRRLDNDELACCRLPGAGGHIPVIRSSSSGGVMAAKSRYLPLWQEIALILALKIALLATIWVAWFSNPESRALDAHSIASRILSSTTQKEPDHGADPGTR